MMTVFPRPRRRNDCLLRTTILACNLALALSNDPLLLGHCQKSGCRNTPDVAAEAKAAGGSGSGLRHNSKYSVKVRPNDIAILRETHNNNNDMGARSSSSYLAANAAPHNKPFRLFALAIEWMVVFVLLRFATHVRYTGWTKVRRSVVTALSSARRRARRFALTRLRDTTHATATPRSFVSRGSTASLGSLVDLIGYDYDDDDDEDSTTRRSTTTTSGSSGDASTINSGYTSGYDSGYMSGIFYSEGSENDAAPAATKAVMRRKNKGSRMGNGRRGALRRTPPPTTDDDDESSAALSSLISTSAIAAEDASMIAISPPAVEKRTLKARGRRKYPESSEDDDLSASESSWSESPSVLSKFVDFLSSSSGNRPRRRGSVGQPSLRGDGSRPSQQTFAALDDNHIRNAFDGHHGPLHRRGLYRPTRRSTIDNIPYQAGSASSSTDGGGGGSVTGTMTLSPSVKSPSLRGVKLRYNPVSNNVGQRDSNHPRTANDATGNVRAVVNTVQAKGAWHRSSDDDVQRIQNGSTGGISSINNGPTSVARSSTQKHHQHPQTTTLTPSCASQESGQSSKEKRTLLESLLDKNNTAPMTKGRREYGGGVSGASAAGGGGPSVSDSMTEVDLHSVVSIV
eukprot:CAMPEP_0181134246 /NCGR_PEP_ID=MMETSP1071-20121207/31990_1 /TAXON_ID=35127 /ORGANISM="Thalassiosira sp., Strain NH16" /LENGTH=626 /DNA_ID=CAMNT_0023220761 /DNA_START=103 /DNA_END=1983 /DNA_ORIENTATION=+